MNDSGSPRDLRVLVVEDDPVTLDSHTDYVRRVSGLRVAGVAASATEAVRVLSAAADPIDLILLDLNLPDASGLDLCRRLRARGNMVDVVAITAARDLATVRASVSLGVVQYLIKPFTFAVFAERMASVIRYLRPLELPDEAISQRQIDEALARLRPPAAEPELAKGLVHATLELVATRIRESKTPLSAREVGEQSGLSRITARRYLEHLVSVGQVTRTPRYGTPGRPEHEYRWHRTTTR